MPGLIPNFLYKFIKIKVCFVLNIVRYKYVKHYKLLYNYHSAKASLTVSAVQSLASAAADVRVSLAPAQSPEAAASLIALPLSYKNYLAWLSFYNCWNLPSLWTLTASTSVRARRATRIAVNFIWFLLVIIIINF